MSPSRPFILRPVATSLLMVALLLSGIMAYRLLPVAALPQVDFPTIQIFTFYPGASPSVMTSSVTAPLERRFGQIPGLNQMSSSSSSGSSVITLQFSLEVSMGVAEQEVQAAINAADKLLPNDQPSECQRAEGQLRRSGAHDPHGRERPASVGGGISQPDHHVAWRRSAALG